jgi:hypothetical protein
LSLAIHGATIAGFDVEARYAGVWWLQGAAIALVIATVVITFRRTGRRLRLRAVLAMVPTWARAAIGVAVLYAVVSLLWLAPATGAGDPLMAGGKHFFNDHGKLRQVSEVAFHAQRAATLRLYSAFWICLTLASAVFLLTARRCKSPA